MTNLAEELLLEFVWQKTDLARSAGVKNTPLPNWNRAIRIWGNHMEAIAKLVTDWNIPPAIIMQAAFDRAKRDRHPDGPQMTMLKSDKYLTQALSVHLELPVAAIRERRGMEIVVETMNQEFAEVLFPPDLLGFTIESPCFRYVEARRRGEEIVAAALAQAVLKRVSEDRRMDVWLSHRGFPYMEIAKHYNHLAQEMPLPDLDEHHLPK
jgi:hypothetical protein